MSHLTIIQGERGIRYYNVVWLVAENLNSYQ